MKILFLFSKYLFWKIHVLEESEYLKRWSRLTTLNISNAPSWMTILEERTEPDTAIFPHGSGVTEWHTSRTAQARPVTVNLIRTASGQQGIVLWLHKNCERH